MAPPQAGSFLKPQEKEWQEVFNRLSERFPSVPGARVAQALREHHGHAGEAAAVLRDLTGSHVKEADPDDVEHVSTLLSSPAMFKHACKEQFKKYDVNKDGVLEWEEVKALVNNLYEEFGLPLPSEGSLKAFFFATDENMDGVLSEREFRKFFEMFLRYAFFDHLKLRQMVEKGQEIEKRLVSANAGGSLKVSEVHDADTESPQESRASSASDTSKPNKPPTPDETQASGLVRVRSPKGQAKPEPARLAPVEHQKEKREKSPQPEQERSHHQREHRNSRQEKERASETSEGSFGTTLRCLASNGVAYRASPAFQDRLEQVVTRGQTVQVLEHWVRTPDGWLPVVDPQLQPLFERCHANPDSDTQCQKKRVSIQELRNDKLDVEVRSHMEAQKSPKPQKSPKAHGSPTADGESLRPNEEEWRPVLERLIERFPNISQDKIVKALRDNNGHAGKAASCVRYM